MFQQTMRDYYRLVTGIDREVGRIVPGSPNAVWRTTPSSISPLTRHKQLNLSTSSHF